MQKIQQLLTKHILPKTKETLLMIAETVRDIADITTVLPQERSALLHGGIEYVRVLRNERADRELRQHIYALKRRKYITTRMIGKKLHCTLTEKGIAETLKLSSKHALPCPVGMCVLVTFDIPEIERRSRLNFRRFLAECGFTQHQRSVWICERDVASLLSSFINTAGIAQWVSVFHAQKKNPTKIRKPVQ